VQNSGIKNLLDQKSVTLEIIFPFVEDPCESIRQLVFDYFEKYNPEKGEASLIEYLQKKHFSIRAYLKNKSRHLIKNIAYTGDGPHKRTMESAKAFNSIPST
jgi:isocitrate dehydrogenase kinase/phosphatase